MIQTEIRNKGEYVAECTSVIQQPLDAKQMVVCYIRKKKAKLSEKLSENSRKIIMNLLQTFPNMSEKSYLAYAKSHGFILSAEEKNELGLESFRAIRSLVSSNNSPMIGVVVAFKDEGGVKIGWSLCNMSKKDKFEERDGVKQLVRKASPDKFNNYDGIRRAIKRAEPIDSVISDIGFTKQMKKPTNKGLVPYTCIPYLEHMIERAKKRFNKAS